MHGVCTIMSLFQFTTSQGGRHQTHRENLTLHPFNSRPHKEVDIQAQVQAAQIAAFQFTTSQGGRQPAI